MIIDLKRYIKKHALLESNDKILCAVSGGVDSISLAWLLHKLGYNISIAHCNFSLRGEESDADQNLVESFALVHNLALHKVRFSTKEYASRQGISIQMAARDLRYEWFEQLCSEHGYNKIAIAHNAGDANETFFINLMRSTGVEGLEGIKPRNGKIVRPLLFATRAQIESHAHQNNIEYRTDSSNLSSYYLRNWIRLEMLPKICDKQPNFSATMMSNMEHISNHNSLFSRVLQRLKSEVMIGDNVYSLSKIKLYESDSVQFLYELLKPMGFSHQNCKSIIDVTSSGRIFMSRTHRALVDRDTLIVEESGNIIDSLGTLTVECVTNCDFSALTPNKILVDGDKIVGDLSLRLYKSGDVISPLGMRGRKKVSDLLIDAKATRFEKERQKIVEDNKEIVWVVGRRASERYKVTPQTKNILLITYHTT